MKLAGIFLLMAQAAFWRADAQCYDLSSTRLYHPGARFHERWDRPIWNGENGAGNFELDERSYGDLREFAIFSVSVRRTPNGWAPFHYSRDLKTFCVLEPMRSGSLCFTEIYQTLPRNAVLVKQPLRKEEWTLTRAGLLSYKQTGISKTCYDVVPTSCPSEDTAEAELDLNTLKFRVVVKEHGRGQYARRVKPAGVELWRDQEFSATARLTETACSVTPSRPPLVNQFVAPNTEESRFQPLCVVRVNKWSERDGEPREFQTLIANPLRKPPEGCVLVFDPEPSPSR